MSVSTTRSIGDLRAECDAAEVRWSLTDTKETLINKLRDKMAGPGPQLHDPMKCKDLKNEIIWGAEQPFAPLHRFFSDRYRAEPKYDGCRMTLVVNEHGNKIYSGRRSVKTYAASDRTDNFPHIRDAAMGEALISLGLSGGAVIDGELLAPSAKIQSHTGVWTDSLLNASVALCNSAPEKSAATQERFGKARFVAFDITTALGKDVSVLSARERRALLESVIYAIRATYPDCAIELAPQWSVTEAVIALAISEGYEGVVIKDQEARYKAGSRSGGWFKVKTMSTADGFVTGYEPGKSGNTGLVGSLELSIMEPMSEDESKDELDSYLEGPDGQLYRIRAVAQVGNLTEAMRVEITNPDGSLKAEFYGKVIEFMGQGVGKNGKVRHPHMVRLRPDKTAPDCMVDQLDVFPRV